MWLVWARVGKHTSLFNVVFCCRSCVNHTSSLPCSPRTGNRCVMSNNILGLGTSSCRAGFRGASGRRWRRGLNAVQLRCPRPLQHGATRPRPTGVHRCWRHRGLNTSSPAGNQWKTVQHAWRADTKAAHHGFFQATTTFTECLTGTASDEAHTHTHTNTRTKTSTAHQTTPTPPKPTLLTRPQTHSCSARSAQTETQGPTCTGAVC